MKKNKIIVYITLLLAGVAVLLIYRNKKGTMNEDLYDFAVKDTAAITKIFLANRNNTHVILERKNESVWMVNGKYRARPDGIRILLSTIKSVAVKTRVAKAGYNGVVGDLAANGIKCEIYKNGETVPDKVYYVGGPTADALGTFMMVENSTIPFVMEIPGFQGYLTTRFSVFEKDWRDKAVFDHSQDEIKNVTITYFQHPEKSFSIERKENSLKVSSVLTGAAIERVDTTGLINYLSFFKYLCFEGWDAEFTDQQQDSLKQTMPLNTISITDMSGVTKSMMTFPKPITRRSMTQADSLGNPLKYDLDRMYAFVNDGNDLVVIQYFVFGKIYRQLVDFDLAKKKNLNLLSR